MKSTTIVLLALAVVILGLLFFVFQMNSSQSDASSHPEESPSSYQWEKSSDPLFPLGRGTNIWDEALSPFSGNNSKGYEEILEDLRSGKINFVWEVWHLRDNCPSDYSPSQCDSTILAYIDANFTSPDREKLRDLYTSYFEYESEMREWKAPEDISFEDRYDLIKEKRRKVLGSQKSDLIFGMEESQVAFLEGSQNFIQSSKNMNPDDRVKKFEELRKKTYGSYYENLMQREDKYDHYTTEIQLREKEFTKLSPEETEKKYAQLEIKYFGKEAAGRIAEARLEEKQEKEKLRALQKQESEIQSDFNLPQKDKDEKIQALRIKILGSEEGEAYSRRIQFEKETNPATFR